MSPCSSTPSVEDLALWQPIIDQNKNWKPLTKDQWNKIIKRRVNSSPTFQASALIEYIKQFEGQSPRKNREGLRKQIQMLEIGCGVGIETLFFLSKGFEVIALDSSQIALGTLQCSALNDKIYSHLMTVNETMENYSFDHRVKIVFAQESLPYCQPEKFKEVWSKIVDSIEIGGIIYCDFYLQKKTGAMILHLDQIEKLMNRSFEECLIRKDSNANLIYVLGRRKLETIEWEESSEEEPILNTTPATPISLGCLTAIALLATAIVCSFVFFQIYNQKV